MRRKPLGPLPAEIVGEADDRTPPSIAPWELERKRPQYSGLGHQPQAGSGPRLLQLKGCRLILPRGTSSRSGLGTDPRSRGASLPTSDSMTRSQPSDRLG